MEERGWRGVFYYAIIDGEERGVPPSRTQVRSFISEHGIEHDVLYDPDGVEESPWEYDWDHGFPGVFIVNPDSMLIWYGGSSWYDHDDSREYMLLTICEEGAASDPGYLP
jgi:hypothetical protein